ncbi:MAG: DUF932 domain-containing protein [Gammaproteobacteria bacterium]
MTTEITLNPNEYQATENGAFKVGNLHAGEARMEVSTAWMNRPDDERFCSLEDLHQATKARYEASRELRIDNRQVEIVTNKNPGTIAETKRIEFGLPSGDLVTPSHWSFGQTATLAGAPPSYLRTLPAPIVSDALTWGLRRNREVEQIKAYYRPTARSPQQMVTSIPVPSQLHAMTGPDYGRIPDFEIVRSVIDINQRPGSAWKVPGVMDWRSHVYDPHHPVTKETTTLFASDRDVFMFLVDDTRPISVGKLPDGSDDLMFRGFYIRNSEMGKSSLELATMYLRAVCCNRILWGVEQFRTFRMRHSKYAPDRWIDSMVPALRSYSERSAVTFQQAVDEAKAAKVAQDDEEALAWLRDKGLNRKRAAEILTTVEREEGHPARSLWDMAQGATALARDIPHQDTRLELESQAGAWLAVIKTPEYARV